MLEERREFLKFMGCSAFSIYLSQASFLTSCAYLPKRKNFLKGLPPSFKDQVVLSPGLTWNIIAQQGDIINAKGEQFGANNDFNCFLPFKDGTNQALLWVNHESPAPHVFTQNSSTSRWYKKSDLKKRDKSSVIKELDSVGGSIVHIEKKKGLWKTVPNSPYSQRLTGRTPIPFSHNFQIKDSAVAMGTLANCSGGLTPWNTFLSSEENYNHFYGDIIFENGKKKFVPSKKYRCYEVFPNPPEHYGWVVEVDPWTGRAQKQVLLGRATHEGATCGQTRSGKTVVYMGEDRPGGFIFKFVSKEKGFEKGVLYAAETKKGLWLPLDIKLSPILSTQFKNQLEVLTYSHAAAQLLGATPQDRPEDIEIDFRNNQILVALTQNPKKKNLYGGILKIKEKTDLDSLEFESSTWLSGGPKTGLACPDNFTLDQKGNLWVTVDVKESSIQNPSYKSFGHNSLFYIPLKGSQAGQPMRVASAPRDSEFSGPWFSSDSKTLFLSVQHPGLMGYKTGGKPTSTWPNGPGHPPKSAVIAIQGPLLDQLVL